MPADFAVQPPAAAAAPPSAATPEPQPLFHDESAPTWADAFPDGEETPSPAEESFGPTWELDAAAEAEERASAPEPAAKPQPKAEEPKGPSTEDLQRELQAAKAELETLGKRFADTQKYANQEHMAASTAQAFMQALQHQEHLKQQLAQQQAAAAPPDPGDLDEWLSDPKKLHQGAMGLAEWSYRRAVGDLSPHVAAMQQELSEFRLMRPLAEKFAQSEAKRSLVAQGVLDQAQAEKLVERALTEVIDHQPQARSYRINPEAIEWAADYLLKREGAPIKVKPKETPTAGTGDQRRPPRRTGLSDTGAKLARHTENILGVKFDQQDLAELARLNRGGA